MPWRPTAGRARCIAGWHELPKQVCPNASNTRLVSEVVLKCRQEALSAAVDKIHNQRLAALHAARMTKSAKVMKF